MRHPEVWANVETIIAEYDLLKHPFYQAWTAGTLKAEDLRRYATDYYHQVSAFPTYLSALHSRLPDGAARRTVLRNLCEEEISGKAHSELWLDFAEGMGARRDAVRTSPAAPYMRALVATFQEIASRRPPLAAMAAFYAYESQVARIAGLKAKGLEEFYGADGATRAYFELHETQDAHHSQVWAEQVDSGLESGETPVEEVYSAVRDAGRALWKSLDGVEAARAGLAARPAN